MFIANLVLLIFGLVGVGFGVLTTFVVYKCTGDMDDLYAAAIGVGCTAICLFVGMLVILELNL